MVIRRFGWSAPAVDHSLTLAVLLVNGINHIGHALVLSLAGEHAIDGLARLAVGMTHRAAGGIGVADHGGLGLVRRAVGLDRGSLGHLGGADDQREFADL